MAELFAIEKAIDYIIKKGDFKDRKYAIISLIIGSPYYCVIKRK